jgi:hypothetical protein
VGAVRSGVLSHVIVARARRRLPRERGAAVASMASRRHRVTVFLCRPMINPDYKGEWKAPSRPRCGNQNFTARSC